MIVVDVGCHPHGAEESVHRLIDRFAPKILLGFDPHPDLFEGVDRIGDTLVVRRRAACWTMTGQVPVYVNGICTGIANGADEHDDAVTAACVDLPALLAALPSGAVLKLDAEGAEYPILQKVYDLGLDERLGLVLVEWHPAETAHGFWVPKAQRPMLRCTVEEW